MRTDEKLKQIESEIKKLSASMRRFRDGPLNRRCVVVLLKDATGLGLSEINAVLDGLEALEERYLSHD